jgi:osmotically-inducible protein OsmY
MHVKTLIFAVGLALAVGPAVSPAAKAETPSDAAKAETPSDAAKAGDYIDDSALTTRVKAALLAEENLESLPISVETTEGVVTLSGKIVSSAQVDEAVDVAKHVEGVKDVHNALELKTDE